MPVVDLTRYIVASTGTWTDPAQDRNLFDFTRADTMSPERLLLRWAGDFVALTGPLRVRVTVQAENMTVPLALVGNLVPDAAGSLYSAPGGTATIHSGVALNEAAVGHVTTGRASGLQASTIYSYTLDVAAGQAWPFSLSEQLAALRLQSLRASRFEQLGNNLGFRVIIEPAFVLPDCTPAAPASDLPCDFAVVDHGNTARFFPTACEPCDGSVIGLPPSGYTALVIPPADGGCVRTRFFNGMFITREDLETEQRYMRMKFKLHNRAAGAGVVWGLRVGKQGSYLCVLPGYGVDCCGNDLTLTTTYKVDIAALIADPAAAPLLRHRGPHRMHLLLEYVECPSDPRPVHGDPCAPANRCEMSRIRESVRLRLVPPRDCDAPDSAPLQKFLDEVREVRKRYPLDPAAEMPPSDRTPFQLRFTPNRRTANAVTVRPSPQTTTVELPSGRLSSLTVEVLPDPLWTFARGKLSAEARGEKGAPVPGIVQGPETIDLPFARGPNSAPPMATFTLPTRAAAARDNVTLPNQLVFRLAGWQAQALFAGQDNPAPASDLTFTVNLTGDGHQNTLAASPVAVAPLDLAAAPCSGDPCTPRQRPVGRGDCNEPGEKSTADPNPVLPWLHVDPVHAKSAGDPKALMLAALGGWLTQMLAREREGTQDEVVSGRREVAQGIYRMAWLLLFGVPQNADAGQVGGTLHRLLEAWCDELLWNGPRCCGDPHGVIIGCALVDGGTIQSIDPFGGRRYVIHYPLLEHWGAQFGLAPLDVTAMRIFSKLCCVASLPTLCVERPDVPASVVALGGGFLAVGAPKAIADKLAEKQIAIGAQRKVGTPEMILSAINAITSKPPTGGQPRYTALVLGDFVAEQTVMLLVPGMIEERIGHVRVTVRTDLPDNAQVRPAAERIVRAVLERCAAVLEERTPGRVVLIRRLPLHWRFDETMLEEPAHVEELAQSAADAIEGTAVRSPVDAIDSSAALDAAVLFDDEAHLRASYLLALARGRPEWFHAVLEESETGDPLAALAAPERRSIAHATLVRLAQEGVLAEVLAAQPAAAVAVLASALGCDARRISLARSDSIDTETTAVEDTIAAELAAAASRWPALGPAAQSLTLVVHAAAWLGPEFDAARTGALAAAALQSMSSLPRVETTRPLEIQPAPQDERAAPAEDVFADDSAREEPGQIVATRCAGLFYLLDRIQELELGQSLWNACLPEGDVLAAAAAALLGPSFSGDSAAALFGGVDKKIRCPKVTLEQHAEVATATCAALAAALPRRGLADIPAATVALVDHSSGRLLVAAAQGSPFAFFAWPALTPETLRAGLSALLDTWPHRGSLEASPALVTLDTSGRLRPWREPPAVSLLLPSAPSAPAAALLAVTAGAPAMLFAARAGDTTPNTVEAFVLRRLARPGRLRITSTGMDVVLDADDIDLDVRRAALDRDPGWLPWLRRTVRFVFEARASAHGEPS